MHNFEHDERQRSNFIRQLMLQESRRRDRDSASAHARSSNLIPKTLVQFWHDARGAPPDVTECLESWDALRDEGFSFRMFNDASAASYIAEHYGPNERDAFSLCWHPAMRSDYLRLCFVL